MPCNSSDGMGDAYREDPEARRKVEELTQMLCAVLRILDSNVTLPPEVHKWWMKHKAWDKSQGR